MPTDYKFDAKTVVLEGSNLIEASAGTGKTYSIAILVLRLIIEKSIPLEKILMVTYTKAAAAELESRIRKFVRKAFQYAAGVDIDDVTIKEVVDQAENQNKAALLNTAVQSLDQLSAMTIHSFCQQVITQFPFETNESFETEFTTDNNDSILYFVNDYWRSELNTIANIEVFRLFSQQLSRDAIKEIIKKSLEDKQFECLHYDKQTALNEIENTLLIHKKAETAYHQHIESNWDLIKQKVGAKGHAFNFVQKSDNPIDFAKSLLQSSNDPKDYMNNCFPEELELAKVIINASNANLENVQKYANIISGELIEKAKRQIEENKKTKELTTFDDLITKVHQAVTENRVNKALLKLYDVAFIDEFQDTDRKQYELFNRLFNDQRIVFYIGDPKQSIYAFRKADINTYKKARNSVQNILSMNTNFRSTQKLIEAMNAFFSINNPFFDTDIEYINVDAGNDNLGEMTDNGEAVIPLSINHFKNYDEIESFVAREILRLLSDKNILIDGKRIEPSDIAVLCRRKDQNAKIKKALSALNIPSITVDETSILQTDEAGLITTLLNLVLKPNRGNINKVLITSAFGYKLDALNTLDEDTHLNAFREFNTEWFENGVYNMLSMIFDKYNIRGNCIANGIIGQRTLSNLYQLAEILHHKSMGNKYSPEELVVWMEREKDNNDEAYEQRIESEDNAVKLSTIHKAKGLTYKIVFAPYLDLNVNTKYTFKEFREDEIYKFSSTLTDQQMELYKAQQEQENRRLIYVALTRAQYKNYICKNTSSKVGISSLSPFLATQSHLFEREIVKTPVVEVFRPIVENQSEFTVKTTPNITIKNTFGIHSFSGLSNAHYTAPFTKEELQEEYDQYIFQTLGRGANVGTALHSIFEQLQFNNPDSWWDTVVNTSKYYSNVLKEESLPHLLNLVDQVMSVEIKTDENNSFILKEIANNQKSPEMEFLFSVDAVNKKKIATELASYAELNGEADIEGLMTGFIDLMFEHKGKFYILDWKSNHLGNSTDCYNREGMEAAMTGSNYHLQYLIYTVALKRFLSQRIPNFNYETHFGGVLYIFLRGVRVNSETGIYYQKPSEELIYKIDTLLKSTNDKSS